MKFLDTVRLLLDQIVGLLSYFFPIGGQNISFGMIDA